MKKLLLIIGLATLWAYSCPAPITNINSNTTNVLANAVYASRSNLTVFGAIILNGSNVETEMAFSNVNTGAGYVTRNGHSVLIGTNSGALSVPEIFGTNTGGVNAHINTNNWQFGGPGGGPTNTFATNSSFAVTATTASNALELILAGREVVIDYLRGTAIGTNLLAALWFDNPTNYFKNGMTDRDIVTVRPAPGGYDLGDTTVFYKLSNSMNVSFAGGAFWFANPNGASVGSYSPAAFIQGGFSNLYNGVDIRLGTNADSSALLATWATGTDEVYRACNFVGDTDSLWTYGNAEFYSCTFSSTWDTVVVSPFLGGRALFDGCRIKSTGPNKSTAAAAGGSPVNGLTIPAGTVSNSVVLRDSVIETEFGGNSPGKTSALQQYAIFSVLTVDNCLLRATSTNGSANVYETFGSGPSIATISRSTLESYSAAGATGLVLNISNGGFNNTNWVYFAGLNSFDASKIRLAGTRARVSYLPVGGASQTLATNAPTGGAILSTDASNSFWTQNISISNITVSGAGSFGSVVLGGVTNSTWPVVGGNGSDWSAHKGTNVVDMTDHGLTNISQLGFVDQNGSAPWILYVDSSIPYLSQPFAPFLTNILATLTSVTNSTFSAMKFRVTSNDTAVVTNINVPPLIYEISMAFGTNGVDTVLRPKLLFRRVSP